MIRSGQYIFNKIIEFCRTVYYKFICHLIGMFMYPVFLIANVRLLNVGITSIGQLCLDLDCFIKEGILDMRPKYKGIILAPHNRVANIHILSYWKPYITIISSPLLRVLLDPLWHNRLTRYDVRRYASFWHKSGDCIKIQNEYFGRPPLLTLTELDYKRGWAALRELGIPQGAWFVCVHCREDGYYVSVGDKIFRDAGCSYRWHGEEYSYVSVADETFRDADINNYLLAMEAIVKRGGWVIRMGDPTMKKIPQMYHVIDYAHLDIKSDWMDVFLCASCKFYLGGPSGLTNLSTVFGVPNVIVNNAPMSTVLACGHAPHNIGIPKLMWSLKEERYLRFKEVFSSPIGGFFINNLYSEAGVMPIENSPQDIRDVAMERMDRIEGKALYTDEDERLQESFKSLMNPSHFSYGANSRVGRDFLRKYEYLLND